MKSLFLQLPGQIRPGLHGLNARLTGHRGPFCDIPCAVLDAAVQHAGGPGKIQNSHVHRNHLAAGGLGHVAYGALPRPQGLCLFDPLDEVHAGGFSSARHDNLPAIELLQLVGEKIGEGIATLLHLLDPDMIVIGGEITRAGDLLLVPTRQALNKFALARIREHCHLQLSNLGENATILGTQIMAIERLQQERGAAFALYE